MFLGDVAASNSCFVGTAPSYTKKGARCSLPTRVSQIARRLPRVAIATVGREHSHGGQDLYLLHVLRRPMEYPKLKRAVRKQCQAFAASGVMIEDRRPGLS